MKRILVLAAAIALLCGLQGTANAAPLTTVAPFVQQLNTQGLQYQIITTGMGTATIGITYAGTFCAAGCTGLLAAATGSAPAVLVGFYSLAAVVNTGTVTCYDSYNSVAGIPIATVVTMPVQTGSVGLAYPGGGVLLQNGLTCVTSTAAATANGIMVVFR